ncbi:MAG TPA: FtsX-like permease family protein, partial [Gemmatimonadaceae bacterium]|nr:FtsX-like permease family protein [Gemmatimonadaceae bacterium]
VMPAGFTLPTGAVAWTAATPDSVMRPGRPRMVEGIGRLRDGVPIARANAEWQLLAHRLDTPNPATAPGTRADPPSAQVLPLAEARHGVDTTLALALLAIATHFLIMCCNVQGALTLRVLRRRRELAIRSALGGGRRDLLRQAVTEIALLLVAACVLGAVLISWGLRATQALLGARFPFLFTVAVDPAVIAVGVGLTLIVSLVLLAGYVWATDSLDLRALLNDGAPTGTRRSSRLRSQLVVLQVALALFLSVLAAGLARSFRLASHTDLGVRADDVLTVPLDLSGTPYDAPDQARALVDQISSTLAVGTRGSSVAVWRSTSPSQWRDTTLVEGNKLPLESFKCRSSTCIAPWSSEDVTPSFFGTLGVPVVRGRAFSSIDGPGDPPVVVLNEMAAAKWWPGQDPIGKRIKLGGASAASPWLTVVGVVHAPYPLDHMSLRLSLTNGNGYPLIFRPLAQTTIDSRAALKSWMWFRKLWVGLAAPNGGGARTQRMVREEIAAIAPDVHIGPIVSLRKTLVDYTGWPTVEANARLASVFGIVGVAIALLGVCGVTAEAVRSRSRELATRMALGASPRLIVQHVVVRAAVLAGSGVALGIATCVVTSGFISRIFLEGDAFVRGERFSTGLRGTSLLDPVILVPLGLALFGVCVLASYLPARAAARIDPATPLRSD